ncbi:hypothetical protein G6O69_29260 [Pseudenhygromyxa sp. WMMC2535]|uniref:hypothetical protein n=1 Tax=Pseudenhygromyxa sp. WMMC2535 TaxID=2712867 RepID=UPI001551A5A7|nr:hypothetical protein [Pseudenhygromyxa sp. WMMC2535]NVB41953.1 hypothetical protein [Pseudenhygromyxa sp. WMMC2535]
MNFRTRHAKLTSTFAALCALSALLSPMDASAALVPTDEELATMESLTTDIACGMDSILLVHDPMSGAVMIYNDGSWWSVNDLLRLRFGARTSIEVQLGLLEDATGWSAAVDTYVDDAFASEHYDFDKIRMTSFTVDVPPADAAALVDVSFLQPDTELPTVPDVVIEPVSGCPSTGVTNTGDLS